LLNRNNADEIAAFRSGLLSSIQAGLMSPNRASLIKNLADPESGVSQILRRALPDDKVDDVVKKLDIAQESQYAKSAIMDRTITGETMIESQAQKLGLSAQTILEAGSMNPRALAAVAQRFVSMFSRDLTPQENARIASILVSEDPGLVRAAIMDETALTKLGSVLGSIVNVGAKVTPTAINRPASRTAGDETGTNVSQGIDMLIGGPR
jgi:hypothetical protein